ncbi:pyridoxal 5'-phosphate synthase subunit SNZERR-like [Babylonia areolata]|uniref:pyridoxal 5'-phosphate synthase subunit SNZERR-like n=1 Tax=Babylonia areolata TaxID=304850 RepID=UPI003FD39D5A
MDSVELFHYAHELSAPHDWLTKTAKMGRLPVPLLAAGGVATLADVLLLMQLEVDGVIVDPAIFNSSDPKAVALALAQAVSLCKDPKTLSEFLGDSDAVFGSTSIGQFIQNGCVDSQ